MFANQTTISRLAFTTPVGFLMKFLCTETQIAIKLVFCVQPACEGGYIEYFSGHA
jgi:hypothetical protein